ncbi:MAG: polyribonucleotide nucleotidyltransferase [Halobacteriovoraceae bacterium]|nr:polyribonucleotide nucleotidyltransferase [Halobacteriovoraceae bacterium]
MNNAKTFTMNFGGKEITVETGKLAKQADGAVIISCEGTQVLCTVCSAKEANEGQDFFPLLVDYKEKFYSAGKFLGGFMKREGRPSTAEILLMRMIDRPFRPMFPEGYLNETIIMNQVLSYDENADAEILAGMGAAAALVISDVPFLSPVGFAKVGKIDGKLVLNPTHKELENSELDMIIAASEEAILMVEGEAKELSEQEMLDAIIFAHEEIKKYCQMLSKMQSEVGKKKREFVPVTPNQTLRNKVKDQFKTDARACLDIVPKLERGNAIGALNKKVAEALKENPSAYGLDESASFSKEAYAAVDGLLYEMMRADILNEEKRIGGRKLNEIRSIETETQILKKTHGSALFTRGETQVLGVVTLGGKTGEQMVDNLRGISYDNFYLHYTFPPFSVGEARGYRGVGRREIGHGNLAERALKNIVQYDNFPYTIRVNCEVLESNGSSSMGSVCSGSMALMDAGVPMSNPVAGIAMGLVKEGDKFKILSDILGDEDHLGDMDFKVAGTSQGITAIQMDIKITGITNEIFSKALAQAKVGREHILGEMAKTISASRSELKDTAPQILTIEIDKDKIGAVIGPGGKNVKMLQEKYGVTVEIDDSGIVKVIGNDKKKSNDVLNHIDLTVNGPKIGEDYNATVVTIKEYGAFVDIVEGISGLVHISELADERVNDVEEYLKIGDPIKVKVLDVDRFGKIKLSAKAVTPLEKKYESTNKDNKGKR